jgi:hypothetical protein
MTRTATFPLERTPVLLTLIGLLLVFLLIVVA